MIHDELYQNVCRFHPSSLSYNVGLMDPQKNMRSRTIPPLSRVCLRNLENCLAECRSMHGSLDRLTGSCTCRYSYSSSCFRRSVRNISRTFISNLIFYLRTQWSKEAGIFYIYLIYILTFIYLFDTSFYSYRNCKSLIQTSEIWKFKALK